MGITALQQTLNQHDFYFESAGRNLKYEFYLLNRIITARFAAIRQPAQLAARVIWR